MKIDSETDALYAIKTLFPDRDIVFYGVTGSRMHGWAKPDSDYDIFAVYADSLGEHVTLDAPVESFQKIEGNVDVNVWSLRKLFNLMLNSNAAAISFAAKFGTREIAGLASACVIPRKFMYHYASVAGSCFNQAQTLEGLGDSDAAQKKMRYGLYYSLCLAYIHQLRIWGNPYVIPHTDVRALVGQLVSQELDSDVRTLVNAGMQMLQPVFTLHVDKAKEWQALCNTILNENYALATNSVHWACADVKERAEALYKKIVLQRAGLLP